MDSSAYRCRINQIDDIDVPYMTEKLNMWKKIQPENIQVERIGRNGYSVVEFIIQKNDETFQDYFYYNPDKENDFSAKGIISSRIKFYQDVLKLYQDERKDCYQKMVAELKYEIVPKLFEEFRDHVRKYVSIDDDEIMEIIKELF